MNFWGKGDERDSVGSVLLETGTVTREQIDEALGRQANGDRRLLGVILIDLGHATAAQVEYALMRLRARRGELKQEDGVWLLERAVQHTKQAARCIDELALAAEEVVQKSKG